MGSPHGRSLSASIPFNIAEAAALLADLINKHGKNGKVDIVGMSLGGYTAIYLAQRSPATRDGLFLSGCGRPWPKPGSFMTWLPGPIMFPGSWSLPHLPEIVLQSTGLDVSDKLLGDVRTIATYRSGQDVAEALSEDKDSEDKTWKKMSERTHSRTCVIAGLINEGEKDTSIRGEQLRMGNPESKAFKLEGKVHAWDLQHPDLFARGIKAWMVHEPLPEEFIII